MNGLIIIFYLFSKQMFRNTIWPTADIHISFILFYLFIFSSFLGLVACLTLLCPRRFWTSPPCRVPPPTAGSVSPPAARTNPHGTRGVWGGRQSKKRHNLENSKETTVTYSRALCARTHTHRQTDTYTHTDDSPALMIFMKLHIYWHTISIHTFSKWIQKTHLF